MCLTDEGLSQRLQHGLVGVLIGVLIGVLVGGLVGGLVGVLRLCVRTKLCEARFHCIN